MYRPRFGSAQKKPAPRVAKMLLAAQDFVTLRIMLESGGVVVFDGDTARITMPAGGSRAFPADLVKEAQARG